MKLAFNGQKELNDEIKQEEKEIKKIEEEKNKIKQNLISEIGAVKKNTNLLEREGVDDYGLTRIMNEGEENNEEGVNTEKEQEVQPIINVKQLQQLQTFLQDKEIEKNEEKRRQRGG